VSEAYNYLSKWEGDDTNTYGSRDYEGVTFTNDGKARKPQPWHVKMTCQNCGKIGHIAAFCKNHKVADTNVQDGEVHEDAEQQLLDAVQTEADEGNYYADLFLYEDQEHRSVSFQIKDGINGGRIPKDWVLLDSQSITDAFSNPDLLRDIHEVRGSLTIHTQAGKAVTKLRGTVPGYGKVWYCPDGIANILSLDQRKPVRSYEGRRIYESFQTVGIRTVLLLRHEDFERFHLTGTRTFDGEWIYYPPQYCSRE
jgi:hypothetical protein